METALGPAVAERHLTKLSTGRGKVVSDEWDKCDVN